MSPNPLLNMTPLAGLTLPVFKLQQRALLPLLAALLLAGCLQPPAVEDAPQVEPPPAPAVRGQLTDFGDPALAALAARLRSGGQVTHIVQLGDSHTAADFFTGSLRESLQEHYGDAGPGWLPPAWIRGQRSATLKPDGADGKQWLLTSSRLQEHDNFPLGGFVLESQGEGSRIGLQPYAADTGSYRWRALYQSGQPASIRVNGETVVWPASARWQWSEPVATQLPLELVTQDARPFALGGWMLDRDAPGVLLSSLGINGATGSMAWRWGDGWLDSLAALEPRLLILAYGTNEAFNDDLERDSYYAALSGQLAALRAALPQTVLLLAGAPDAIRYRQEEGCNARRPRPLAMVQAVQRQVAREQQTLYWDWQAMMGGRCSFERWQDDNLAQPDGVHLTRAGYEASARALYRDLQALLQEQD
ncbi:MAG: hypothetical protein GX665_00730 [Gammaproteobacteria bacterium]|nr:hypothetical protein [Gammaproteobacteria bacterium]